MIKYPKFVFDELPQSSIIARSAVENYVEEDSTVIAAVTEHLQKLVRPDNEFDNDNNAQIDTPIESVVDELNIEKIKEDSYNEGFKSASLDYEKRIEHLTQEMNFTELVKERVSSITNSINIEQEALERLTTITVAVAKKLYLILPVDFKAILCQELINSLTKFYKKGEVTLIVHPARYELSQKILGDSLTGDIKDNIKLIVDETLAQNDCKINWMEAIIEYNQAQVEIEVSRILEQLQNAASI